ncbi:MAG TPA: 4Fe-4S dicluster domain-containing protein [Verrucomicrobiae bacterium]
MIETARNFAGSYRDKERLTTVQYPEEKLPPVENARTIPFLVFDGGDAMPGLRCTACQICEKECPPQCIYIIKDTVKKPDYVGKMQVQPKVFDIDISVCMSCGICVEVCPFDAIKMDQVFELSTSDRFGGLLLNKTQLAKPNEYYGKLHKTEAAEIDVRREEDKVKAAAAAAAKAAAPKPAPAAAPKPAAAPAPAASPTSAAPAPPAPAPGGAT